MRVQISEKLALEVLPTLAELEQEPEVKRIEEEASAQRVKLEARVAELESKLSKFESLTDFATREKVCGKRYHEGGWQVWNGSAWVADNSEEVLAQQAAQLR